MRIAIVTGASSGMGRLFVRQIEQLYKDLDEIWVIARRKERLVELSSVVMTKLRILDGDLNEQKFLEKLEELLQMHKPDIRMLVNAAGFGKIGEVTLLERKEQLAMIDLNCRTLVEMTMLCSDFLSEGSRIINLASAAAFCPQPYFTVYAATKSFVLSFSRGIKEELQSKGVFVTAVCPGPVKTEFFDIAGNKKGILKDSFMAKPEMVVKQALLDARAGNAVSVYGNTMKVARICAKLLPHGMITKIMKKLWSRG